MATHQKPKAGNWYVNLAGQLLKVSMVSYLDGNLAKVVIEHLSGAKTIVDIRTWNLLDLDSYIYNTASLSKNNQEKN